MRVCLLRGFLATVFLVRSCPVMGFLVRGSLVTSLLVTESVPLLQFSLFLFS